MIDINNIKSRNGYIRDDIILAATYEELHEILLIEFNHYIYAKQIYEKKKTLHGGRRLRRHLRNIRKVSWALGEIVLNEIRGPKESKRGYFQKRLSYRDK